MIQDDIIKELQYIPETKLTELFDIIHSFRLRFNNVNQYRYMRNWKMII